MKTADEILSLRLAVCYVLADRESANGSEIKTAIEDHVGEYLRDACHYDVLDDLVDAGILQKDNLNPTHDRYQLTSEGREQLENQHAWFSKCLDESTGQQKF